MVQNDQVHVTIMGHLMRTYNLARPHCRRETDIVRENQKQWSHGQSIKTCPPPVRLEDAWSVV